MFHGLFLPLLASRAPAMTERERSFCLATTMHEGKRIINMKKLDC
jgi:hypothetical protein